MRQLSRRRPYACQQHLSGRHSFVSAVSCLCVLLCAIGCHSRSKVAYVPPPPVRSRTSPHPVVGDAGALAVPPSGFFDDTHGKPVFTETGLASWYGPKYNHHAAADGSIYDQNAPTAAHRTLPLGSTVRVTNLATGQQTLVRITDRGPFVPGRVLDLSMQAAKEAGIYRLGVAQVKVEAFRHTSADPAGRWCVQTGPFATELDALDLKTALHKRYEGAKVAEFQGPTGFWVRIDPADGDQAAALKMQDWIGKPDPRAAPYLVRID